MSAQAGPPKQTAQGEPAAGPRLPAIARYWWFTALGGLVALTLALAIVVLRDRFSGLVDPDVLIELLGISAVLTGLLRGLGGLTTQERFGPRWTLGGIVLGTLELAFGSFLLLTSRVDPDLLRPIGVAGGRVGSWEGA